MTHCKPCSNMKIRKQADTSCRKTLFRVRYVFDKIRRGPNIKFSLISKWTLWKIWLFDKESWTGPNFPNDLVWPLSKLIQMVTINVLTIFCLEIWSLSPAVRFPNMEVRLRPASSWSIKLIQTKTCVEANYLQLRAFKCT